LDIGKAGETEETGKTGFTGLHGFPGFPDLPELRHAPSCAWLARGYAHLPPAEAALPINAVETWRIIL